MTIDTNILIAYLTEDLTVKSFLNHWRNQGAYFYLPTVVIAEVLAFEKMTDNERKSVKQFLKENFITIPFNENLVDLVANIRMISKLKLPDAIIAATALHTGTALLTRNLKDFQKVKDLELIEI